MYSSQTEQCRLRIACCTFNHYSTAKIMSFLEDLSFIIVHKSRLRHILWQSLCSTLNCNRHTQSHMKGKCFGLFCRFYQTHISQTDSEVRKKEHKWKS